MPRRYLQPTISSNVSSFFPFWSLIIIILLISYIAFTSFRSQSVKIYNKSIIKEPGCNNSLYNIRPNYGYTNIPGDVLMNPYEPPLKDDRYFTANTCNGSPKVPINVSTNIGAVDTAYRQVGILTPVKGPNKILSLMGRPLFTSRDKWQFYTMSENNIKLPIVRNGRSCTSEYGCDNIFNGDNVYVEGYGEPFKVTMYENNVMKYLPFI